MQISTLARVSRHSCRNIYRQHANNWSIDLLSPQPSNKVRDAPHERQPLSGAKKRIHNKRRR
jgi:hypothetical protein